MHRIEEVPVSELSKLKQATPDSGWHDPAQFGQICLMCGLKIFQNLPVAPVIKKCPNCGFEMTKVERIGLIMLGEKVYIMTDPN